MIPCMKYHPFSTNGICNIHVMCQAGRMRIALHGYNTPDDVDKLLSTLKAALAELS